MYTQIYKLYKRAADPSMNQWQDIFSSAVPGAAPLTSVQRQDMIQNSPRLQQAGKLVDLDMQIGLHNGGKNALLGIMAIGLPAARILLGTGKAVNNVAYGLGRGVQDKYRLLNKSTDPRSTWMDSLHNRLNNSLTGFGDQAMDFATYLHNIKDKGPDTTLNRAGNWLAWGGGLGLGAAGIAKAWKTLGSAGGKLLAKTGLPARYSAYMTRHAPKMWNAVSKSPILNNASRFLAAGFPVMDYFTGMTHVNPEDSGFTKWYKGLARHVLPYAGVVMNPVNLIPVMASRAAPVQQAVGLAGAGYLTGMAGRHMDLNDTTAMLNIKKNMLITYSDKKAQLNTFINQLKMLYPEKSGIFDQLMKDPSTMPATLKSYMTANGKDLTKTIAMNGVNGLQNLAWRRFAADAENRLSNALLRLMGAQRTAATTLPGNLGTFLTFGKPAMKRSWLIIQKNPQFGRNIFGKDNYNKYLPAKDTVDQLRDGQSPADILKDWFTKRNPRQYPIAIWENWLNK